MKLLASVLMVLTGALLFAFIALNTLLGCETWDRSQWTPRSSCVTPAELLGGFFSL